MTTSKDETLEALTRELIRKLDVTLPKLTGVANFHAIRSGGRDVVRGPNPYDEIEKLRNLLGLPTPAAIERDYWPEDWCRHCDGSGKVPPTQGIHPYGECQEADLYLAGVRDEDEAVRILLKTKVDPDPDEELLGPMLREDVEAQRPTEEQARAIIRNLPKKPLYLEGSRIYRLREAWTKAFMKVDATFVYIRRCVWPVFDACPECKGTANRGLPEATPWHRDQDRRGPWPEGEVIFKLDRDQTWDQFLDQWNRWFRKDT